MRPGSRSSAHGLEDASRYAITVTDAGTVPITGPIRLGSYAWAKDPAVRSLMTSP